MPKTVRPIHANRGIEARYKKRMNSLVDEMHSSIQYWLEAAYKKSPPAMAQDASPSDRVKKEIDKLAKRWQDRFNSIGPWLAENYIKGMFKATDSAFKQALKASGWAVEFKMTRAMKDALNASINENIGLIRSIPEQYFGKVEGIVMRSYTRGRDLHTMVTELNELYPHAKHRTELIARDQSNKANAVVQRARQLELGITEAIWMHSHAGKVPRPSHVAANGRKYKVAEGCLIDGEYIFPGEEINCRCTCRAVLPF